ncbi:MAG: GGDEF domain-containing protein [Lachnospiraceae bacterium]|nr:GGDEF domain-containing protein [Lachnospiraceae bacterium]
MRLSSRHFIIAILILAFSAVFLNANTYVANADESGLIALTTADEQELSGEIEVIFNRNEEDMKPYVEAFEKKYPGVKVKYTCYNDFETSIKLRMEEGDYGDVMYIPGFMSSDEITDYFEPLGDYNLLSEKYNYIDQGRHFDNIVYGIPSSAYLLGVVYNKEVFDKAGISDLPTTIDEFLYAMYLIDEHTDALPFYVGYSEPWCLSYWELFPYIEMSGSASYKYNEFIVDINPFREGTVHNTTYRLLYDLVEQGYTEMNKETVGWWDSVIKLNNGDIGCTVMGTWALYDYKNVGPNGDDIAFMPFPNNIDGDQYVTVTANYSYAVAKNSDNKEAAKAFVEFILDESGYAFEHDLISILKTDPYPECYGDMEEKIMQNVTYISPEAYSQYETLSTNLKLYNQEEYVRIVEAAAGIRDENFDDIMNDWNSRWESSRASWMISGTDDDKESGNDNDVIIIENAKVELSDNEKKYVQDNPVVRVGYHKNLAPLSYFDGNDFAGIARTICDDIAKKTGLVMEYHGYENTDELVAALESGDITLIAGIEKLKYNNNIKYSKEYLEFMEVLVRHNTTSNLKKCAIANGEEKSAIGEDTQRLACSNINKCIESVQTLKADFAITNYYTALYYMRTNGYDDVTVIPYANDQTYHIGFSKDTNPVLVAICNKCVYSIPEGETEIELMEHMDAIVKKVTLATFIKANPLLCITIIIIACAMVIIIVWEKHKAIRKQALDAKKYELLASLANEYFFEYDYAKEVFRFDAKAKEGLGLSDSEIIRKSYDGDNLLLRQFGEQISKILDQGNDEQLIVAIDKGDGNKQWYRIVTSVVLNKRGQPIHMVGKLLNIQKEMERLESYQDKAYKDALTKLYNREGLSVHMPKEANGIMFAIMDIDDFKMVNDTLGHSGGDYALMYFADKIKEYMGEKSLVARFGGDEFIAVLAGVSKEEADKRLGEIVKAMDVDIRYAGITHKLSISAGAIYSEIMMPFEEMFDEADKILYKTKEEGKNNYRFEVLRATNHDN